MTAREHADWVNTLIERSKKRQIKLAEPLLSEIVTAFRAVVYELQIWESGQRPPPPPVPPAIVAAEQLAFDLICKERSKHGMKPLVLDAAFSESARIMSARKLQGDFVTSGGPAVISMMEQPAEGAVARIHAAIVRQPREYSLKMLYSQFTRVGVGVAIDGRRLALTQIYGA